MYEVTKAPTPGPLSVAVASSYLLQLTEVDEVQSQFIDFFLKSLSRVCFYREIGEAAGKITVNNLRIALAFDEWWNRYGTKSWQIRSQNRFREGQERTVINGITAPDAIDAISEMIMMITSTFFAYRNNEKYPTVNVGAVNCLSMISFSCSLRPAMGDSTCSDGAPCFSLIATPDDVADGFVFSMAMYAACLFVAGAQD